MQQLTQKRKLKNAPRVVVIGLDGATFDYISPLIADGELPNLSRLVSEGTCAVLRSVIPPMTPSAWPSLVTGTTPDAHGIFGWFEPLVTDYSARPVSSGSLQFQSIWHILGDLGHKVGVMNVPLTYPASPVNGFLVAGFDSPFQVPKWKSRITYPDNLLDGVQEETDGYEIIKLLGEESSDPVLDPMFWAHSSLADADLNQHMEEWADMERRRTSALLYLNSIHKPEFLMVVHHILDYFSHRATRNSVLMRDAHRVVDECIGRILEICDDETTVFIVSDHGHTETNRMFYIHKWLVSEGYLAFYDRPTDLQLAGIAADYLNLGAEPIPHSDRRTVIADILDAWNNLNPKTQNYLGSFLQKRYPGYDISHANIDWGRTKAFVTSPYGLIYVNLKDVYAHGTVNPGKEYDEFVDELVLKLKKLVDPYTKAPVAASVFRGDQYFKHFRLGYSPDVIMVQADYGLYVNHLYPHYLKADKIVCLRQDMDQRFSAPQYGLIGDHSLNGVFACRGPNVRRGYDAKVIDIVDVFPTILHMFDEAIPKYADGRVAMEIFKAKQKSEPRYRDLPPRAPLPGKLSEEEESMIKKQLQRLGYQLS